MFPTAKDKWINMISKKNLTPYLDYAGYQALIRLRKQRFHCKVCRKVSIAGTFLVKKSPQISSIINQKITQKLIKKVHLTVITKKLFSSIVFTLYNISAELWVVCVFKSWINWIENRTSIRHSNVTGNSFNRVIDNSAINDFIALLFACTWRIKKF